MAQSSKNSKDDRKPSKPNDGKMNGWLHSKELQPPK